jgi:hypothetical protein
VGVSVDMAQPASRRTMPAIGIDVMCMGASRT